MTDSKLIATLDRDWISLVLYSLIWALWIVALVRNPVHAFGLVIVLSLVANPFIERRFFGVEIRTNSEISGRHLHRAFRTKDDKTVIYARNRTGRRIVLAMISALVALQAFDVLKSVDLQQHPAVIIGGFIALAAFFALAFVLACLVGMRSGQVTKIDTVP